MNGVQAQTWVESFSTREIEVLQLVSEGLSNRDIAQKLFLSIETVKWYNKQIFMKLGVKNRTQAVNKAVELNVMGAEYGLPLQERPSSIGNLPAQLTPYVGRKKEIGEIKDLLKEKRLVVLTGAGGSGKTRLSLKVGEELKNEYKDGVWLVELANLNDPFLVLQTIAKVLNITERADTTLDETLKQYLSKRHLLLLIDNLEHLLECAPLIGELLSAAPQLSVLGTSREPLYIYGEQEYPVHPLNLPDLSNLDGSELENIDSIALFIKRAQSVHPAFHLDENALKDLARICIRLDGLPLAIELCAPMVKMFPLGVIAERIEKSLDALPSGPRDLPVRQQTLRGAIQWGFDLLKENEKLLFIRMAVFKGGGTLQAVEIICGDGISGSIGNILASLVNKNLVSAQERPDGEIYFNMLETIRQYAHEKLLISDEADMLVDRHARYFMEFAGQNAIELRGPGQVIWMDRFIALQDNFRAGLERVIAVEAVESALQFVYNMNEFWLRHSDLEEGQKWMDQVMALPNAQQYREKYSEVFNNLALFCFLRGKIEEARDMAEQALAFARSQSRKQNTAEALLNLGLILQMKDIDKVEQYQKEARDIYEETHDEYELARILMHNAILQSQKGEYDEAHSLFYESFNLYKKYGDILFQGVVMRLIGNLEMEQNKLPEGVEAHREALRIVRTVNNTLQIANCIFELARAAKIMGNHMRALQLYVASRKIFENIGAWWSGDEPELEEEIKTARAVLGDEGFQAALAAVETMTMDEVVELALSDAEVLKK